MLTEILSNAPPSWVIMLTVAYAIFRVEWAVRIGKRNEKLLNKIIDGFIEEHHGSDR